MFPGDRISQGHLNRGAECAETRDAKGLEGVAENDFSAYKASQNALGCTAEGVDGLGNRRGISLPIRLGALGSVVSSPSGVRGGAAAENDFSAFKASQNASGCTA